MSGDSDGRRLSTEKLGVASGLCGKGPDKFVDAECCLGARCCRRRSFGRHVDQGAGSGKQDAGLHQPGEPEGMCAKGGEVAHRRDDVADQVLIHIDGQR